MYDVIIVGARISGSALAMVLADRGYRVLVVDRITFPSPTSSSTNLIHPPGVNWLRRWGILDRLNEHSIPEITHYSLQSGPARLVAPLPSVEGVGYALSPPRISLDQALADAAVAAGAELREGVSIQELLTENGVVTGVSGVSKTSGKMSEKATIVVGADGKNSRVAQLVDARKYRDQPVLSKSSWTYWEGLEQEPLVRTYRKNRRHPFSWPTHDGLSIVGVAWPTDTFPTGDPEQTDRSVIEAFTDVDPEFAERLRQAKRGDRWLTGSVPNFLRTSHGPGWALVGDAGATRDPITASGITHALLGADLLADAITDGLENRPMAEAMAGYTARRDRLIGDHYDYTRDYARVADHSPEERALIAAMSRSPRHGQAMIGLFATVVPPEQFYTRDNFRELFGYLGGAGEVPWTSRLVRWLIEGVPGRPAWASGTADRLIASKLGPMGELLLRSPVPGGSGRRPVSAPTA
ncbi:NAD(P)/FAD-dependent oxidoreductase [Kitasatospora viridis]|uniref:Flavin-dependent dehydrogenase n=1 Tax=Kitasatospora viridis TaxID=281105 RepID=A0A561UD53_9ACTN|nr:NAD(P)/FAD-dependent oxidoreductase [Kitasatospora viridis]TWF97300.1 flavin-dependent dehydrogenase [Kitasatospora viridis]